MIVFWCWPLLILTSVYRGVLFSMLTVPEFIYLVNDIKELPARPEISVYVWKGSAIDEYFVVSSSMTNQDPATTCTVTFSAGPRV